MKYMEFIATLVGHIIWPATLLIMYFLLRDKISNLLDQLARLKYKDIELDFEKVRQQAEELREEPTINSQDRPEEAPVFKSLDEQILETAERAPAASILLAWSSVETALATATSRLATSSEAPSYRSPVHNIEILERQGKISRQQVRLFHELRTLRNKLTHDGNSLANISELQALEYASAARTIVEFLNGLERVYKIVDTPNGEWIELPQGFVEIPKNSQANYWLYSNVSLANTEIKAGVGPWKGPEKNGAFAYYGIDLEIPEGTGSKVISELLVGLELVDPEIITKKAHEVVSYDSNNEVVTFNLGRSIFRYKIHKKH